jgi:hypothetical protein
MGDLVPRKTLEKQGMKALGGIGGGVGLMVLQAIAGGAALSVPGIIVGCAVTLVGLAISSSRDDRKAGLLTAAAGAATILASLPILGGLAGSLMWLGGAGLLVMGGINLFKFLKGMRKNNR